uniref:Peptidase S28 domain containing protein n=1 Tax=Haemonchus contortus TaxID=6289 RepID=A0A7I4Y8C7_HAECO
QVMKLLQELAVSILSICLFLIFVSAKNFLDHDGKCSETPSLAAHNKWYVKWIDVKVDHFTYSDTRTFRMKWLWNNTFYKTGGPIFIYTGNEGDIECFTSATGMMWDLAPRYNAAIIFAEHRFYGESQPFGNQSYATIENMGYLTSEQALADYAALIYELKTPNNSLEIYYPKETPVIAVGGSYGGIWFRMKYPHLITGAWAGGAPLIYFKGGGVDQGAFDSITTRTYVDAGCNRFIVANSWNAILNLSSTDDGRNFLNTQFKIDPRSRIKTRDDGRNLNDYFRKAIEYMAIVNYPYPTGFLRRLPGYPVRVACGFMNDTRTSFTDKELATMMYNGANVYYNTSGNLQYHCIDPSACGDPSTANLGSSALGWLWQGCSEIVIDLCARGGENDFFWDECNGNSTARLISICASRFQNFNWTPAVWNVDAVPNLYGLTMAHASNIILTQGPLDPWSAGGYKPSSDGKEQDHGIYIMEIPGTAHHLDFRTPNTCDPNTVINARFQIVGILDCWINGCASPPRLTPLPAFVDSNLENCAYINHGYPWGQAVSSSLTPTTGFAMLVLLLQSFFF